MVERKAEGGCQCGALRYEAKGEPLRVGLCWCETCRRNTGAVMPGFAVYPADKVRIEGKAEGYRTSAGLERFFCPTCGSPVYSHNDAGETVLYHGSLDRPRDFPPSYELWAKDRPGWLPDLPGVRRFDTHRG
ncbi:MAG: GFA family protein [Rhodospirillaceae bacterium]|jgi:hypothetical protein|nr:GFA family protein [Rhodospirillaceae bacterium]MBT6119746.1 GFA family protein [Rhodospirillaceae bacterium]